MTFFANRAYDSKLDVRDLVPLSTRVQDEPPAGVVWLLVAPRRGRKTWTLRGLQRELRAVRAEWLDLQRGLDLLPSRAKKKGYYYLLDETHAILRDPVQAQALIERCAELHSQEARVVVAVTPAECQLLLEAGRAQGRVSEKAILGIEPLSEAEAQHMASRSSLAESLLRELPSPWKRSAFLLELLFELQGKEPLFSTRKLLRTALEECRAGMRNYFHHVFQEGLLSAQRELLRRALRGQALPRHDVKLLIEAGMLAPRKKDGLYELNDPVLSAAFAPLRIHHVSDVHVGPKSAQTIDAKGGGRLAIAADNGTVRDSYTQHLQQLAAQDEAPHLVVLSGDLTEWATEEQLQAARAWVTDVQAHLSDSPLLDVADPRILLVGGNHDVSWSLSMGGDPLSRHRPFAQTFIDYPRPKLELDPAARPVATAAYPDFGVEFLLLGSAELGGETDEATEKELLLLELAAAGTDAATAEKAKKTHELALKAARIDPGLVHAKDLQRASAHGWNLPIRIAVLHHPVSPLPTSTEIAQYAGLLNAGAVKDLLLSRGFCLVLHGHAHAAWFGVEHWPELHEGRCLHIASAPSLSSREVTENHGYNLIEIYRDYDDQGNPSYSVQVCRKLRKGSYNWQASGTLPAIQLPKGGGTSP